MWKWWNSNRFDSEWELEVCFAWVLLLARSAYLKAFSLSAQYSTLHEKWNEDIEGFLRHHLNSIILYFDDLHHPERSITKRGVVLAPSLLEVKGVVTLLADRITLIFFPRDATSTSHRLSSRITAPPSTSHEKVSYCQFRALLYHRSFPLY